MKQILVFVLSYIICLHTVVYASEVLPALDARLAEKSLLLDIVAIEQSKLVAVGERGHILTSNDAENWQQASVPIQSTLTSVFFQNSSLGWAVGHDSSILHTSDGGKNWLVQQYLPESEKPLLDVVFKDPNNGIAIGAYGQFFRTLDGGKHWAFEFHDEFLLPEDAEYLQELKLEDEEAYLDERGSILPHFNRLLKDGRTLYLAGEIGLIAKSNDFGKTWQKLEEVYQGSFFDLVRTKQGSLLVVGLRGNVFRSLTNGITWQHIQTNTTALLNTIILGVDETIYILGNNGLFLESKDDGQKFISRLQSDGKALVAGVWFKGKIIAVSDVGIKTITITTPGLFE